MNILVVHQNFLEKDDPGGSRFNEMTAAWEAAGHHVTVLAGQMNHATGRLPERYKGKYIYVDQYSENRVVLRSHGYTGQGKGFFGRLMGYFSFTISSTISGIFKARKKYDVIIATSPPLFVGVTGIILSFLKRIPLVFEVRDLWPESAIDTGMLTNKTLIRFAYWFEAFVYRYARLINALTPAFREKMIHNKGVAPEKVLMIPNAADFTLSEKVAKAFDRDAFRKEIGIDGKHAIIYVGAHGIANHLIQVIDTAEILAMQGRDDIVFMLVGDGAQKEMLKERAENLGLTNVLFFDPVPKQEVFKYILAADFGSSILKKVDTFKTIYSNKTFDYMACKRPVMMVIDGVSRKLVEDAQCGVYIEPENEQEFAEKAITFAAMSPADRAAMGERGYQFAINNFDRQVLAAKYLKELHRITGIQEQPEHQNIAL